MALQPAALSPWTYLLRNPRRIAPVFLIQVLVTALLVLIITPTNAFEATARANVKPLDGFTIVRPRVINGFDEELLRLLDANPQLRARVEAKMFWLRMPMIVGEGVAPMIALPQSFWAEFLDGVGSTLIDGEMPEPGSDGVVLHEAVVRAKGLKIGEAFGKLVDPQDMTPGRFTLVGVLGGEARIGLADHAYASEPLFVLARVPPFQVIYAKAGGKAASDAYLREARHEEAFGEGEKAFDVIDAAYMDERIAGMLANLPLIIGFITLSVGIVVALVISLLNVIAFQVRVDEFGLYLAVGHRRARLVRKLAVETAAVAIAAWLAGLALGIGGVALYRDLWLEPRGILLTVVDPRPLLFSLSVPVLSTLTGAIALGRRLHRMDPVAVIQRRGAG